MINKVLWSYQDFVWLKTFALMQLQQVSNWLRQQMETLSNGNEVLNGWLFDSVRVYDDSLEEITYFEMIRKFRSFCK